MIIQVRNKNELEHLYNFLVENEYVLASLKPLSYSGFLLMMNEYKSRLCIRLVHNKFGFTVRFGDTFLYTKGSSLMKKIGNPPVLTFEEYFNQMVPY